MTFSINHRRLALVLCAILITSVFPISAGQAQTSDPLPNKVYLPIVLLNYDASWQWETLQQVSLSPTQFNTPMSVIDNNGYLHIFWDTWAGQNAFIYHLYQTGSGWSSAEAIAQTLGNSKLLAAPIASPDGSIHIIWNNSLNPGGPVRIMYAVWKNGTWSPEIELHRANYAIFGGSLGFDSNGKPVALFSASDDYIREHFYYCQPTSSGCAGKVEPPIKLAAFNDLYLDHSGGVIILDQDYVGNQQYYSYWKDSKLLINSVDIGAIVNHRSGVVDGPGRIYFNRTGPVPIPGGNVTGLYQQCLNPNQTWSADQVLSGQKEVAFYRYAMTASGAIVSAWQSSSSNPVVLDRWDNCSSISNKLITVPPPSTSSWGKLSSLSVSDQPKKICLVLAKQFAPSDYGVYCVNIL